MEEFFKAEGHNWVVPHDICQRELASWRVGSSSAQHDTVLSTGPNIAEN
jgi:hypothetical protein